MGFAQPAGLAAAAVDVRLHRDEIAGLAVAHGAPDPFDVPSELVAEHNGGLCPELAFENVLIRPADRCGIDADEHLVVSRLLNGNVGELEVVAAVEDRRLHASCSFAPVVRRGGVRSDPGTVGVEGQRVAGSEGEMGGVSRAAG